MSTSEVIAKKARVKNRRVCLVLSDGREFSFAADSFPLLADASEKLLAKVKLEVGGRALRWEELDEDIWVASVVSGKTAKTHSAFM